MGDPRCCSCLRKLVASDLDTTAVSFCGQYLCRECVCSPSVQVCPNCQYRFLSTSNQQPAPSSPPHTSSSSATSTTSAGIDILMTSASPSPSLSSVSLSSSPSPSGGPGGGGNGGGTTMSKQQQHQLNQVQNHIDALIDKFISHSGCIIPYQELQFEVPIGRGSYSEVFRGKWKNCPVAIKILTQLSPKGIKAFNGEAAFLSTLRHPNILPFLGACIEPSRLCIVTEYMENGNLFEFIHSGKLQTRFPNQSDRLRLAHRIAVGIARGMFYLHSKQIIHRDLKSLNVLLDDSLKPYVADFGLTRIKFERGTMTIGLGSPAWMAPEAMTGDREYGFSIDVYSFGVILWELLALKIPFSTQLYRNPLALLHAVVDRQERPPIDPTWPQEWTQLICQCWAHDPNARPTFETILAVLETFPISAGGSKATSPSLSAVAAVPISHSPQFENNLLISQPAGFVQQPTSPSTPQQLVGMLSIAGTSPSPTFSAPHPPLSSLPSNASYSTWQIPSEILVRLQQASADLDIRSLMSALRANFGSSTVAVYGLICLELNEIVHRDLRARARIVSEGGLANILNAMSQHTTDERLNHDAILALANIAFLKGTKNVNYAREIYSYGGISTIIDTLQQFPLNEHIQRSGLLLLTGLCASLDDRNFRIEIARLGSIKLCIEIMRRFPDSDSIQTAACRTLTAVMFDTPVNKGEITDSGGISLIIKAMQRFPDNGALQSTGCGALSSIGFDAAPALQIARDGGISVIVAAMRQFRDNPTIQANACRALTSMAFHHAEYRSEIVRLDAIDDVIAAMKRFAQNENIQSHACTALSNISIDAANIQPICKKGGLTAIMQAMQLFRNNEDIQNNAFISAFLNNHDRDDSWATLSPILDSANISVAPTFDPTLSSSSNFLLNSSIANSFLTSSPGDTDSNFSRSGDSGGGGGFSLQQQ